MPRRDLVQFRAGPAALWVERNPTLEAGEPGLETDTRRVKIGDGSSDWNTLAYLKADVDLEVSTQEIVDAVLADLEPPIDLNVLVLNALA